MKNEVTNTKIMKKFTTFLLLADKYLLAITEHPKIHPNERSTRSSVAYSDKFLAHYMYMDWIYTLIQHNNGVIKDTYVDIHLEQILKKYSK